MTTIKALKYTAEAAAQRAINAFILETTFELLEELKEKVGDLVDFSKVRGFTIEAHEVRDHVLRFTDLKGKPITLDQLLIGKFGQDEKEDIEDDIDRIFSDSNFYNSGIAFGYVQASLQSKVLTAKEFWFPKEKPTPTKFCIVND